MSMLLFCRKKISSNTDCVFIFSKILSKLKKMFTKLVVHFQNQIGLMNTKIKFNKRIFLSNKLKYIS